MKLRVLVILSKGCTSGRRLRRNVTDILMQNKLMIVNTISKAPTAACGAKICRLRLKYDGIRAETRFRLSAKRTSPFKSAGGRQFSRLLVAEVCASALVMLDTPCSEVVRGGLATHSIRQFPLHFPSLCHRMPSHFNWSLPTLRMFKRRALRALRWI